VLQVVVQQNYDNTYRPHVEWANVRYEFTPDFSVRLGRTVLTAFLMSDTRNVGYTYPWVRPPTEVYRLLQITASDGMDVSYRLHFGEVTNTVQAVVGGKNTDLPNNGGNAAERDAWGISNTTEYGSLTVRATYRHSTLSIASHDANPISFFAVGTSYDPGEWFVMAEWGRNDSMGRRNTAWYASGGYRIGEFTPYVTYAHSRADNRSAPGLNTVALPPPAFNGVLNSILSVQPVQNTISVGTRWDFMKNTALKVQFDHTRIGAGSSGTLINLQPGYQTGGSLNVFSTTIDFVF
jgi:predicted porin